jgi:hypothetical protein
MKKSRELSAEDRELRVAVEDMRHPFKRMEIRPDLDVLELLNKPFAALEWEFVVSLHAVEDCNRRKPGSDICLCIRGFSAAASLPAGIMLLGNIVSRDSTPGKPQLSYLPWLAAGTFKFRSIPGARQ